MKLFTFDNFIPHSSQTILRDFANPIVQSVKAAVTSSLLKLDIVVFLIIQMKER
jgi:hypothetical protein